MTQALPHSTDPNPPSPPWREPPVIDVRTLVGEGKEAVIVHGGQRYRLRITANDKLILTK
ncbi:Hemin uptake protein HemP [Rhizobiales bacterium GAS191]|jgi:hemin uptake protein HemP|nr:Hemin uptake protein HemP [Rhizobiales bacterium GAS113]SEE25307.1 Hemin uptake protein HemP [Rhizobiales bacterium GAS188]SEE32299.1 Hemin uptake protein HemP [Rhizobiales bacterium GAS191]